MKLNRILSNTHTQTVPYNNFLVIATNLKPKINEQTQKKGANLLWLGVKWKYYESAQWCWYDESNVATSSFRSIATGIFSACCIGALPTNAKMCTLPKPWSRKLVFNKVFDFLFNSCIGFRVCWILWWCEIVKEYVFILANGFHCNSLAKCYRKNHPQIEHSTHKSD